MTPYQNMPDNARIWIYQADRELTNEEAAKMRLLLSAFVEGWTAHKASLRAHADVIFKRFIIILADEETTKASGCSIDASVRFLKEIEQQFNVDLFNRLNILYIKDGEVLSATKNEFEQLIQSGAIQPETLIFNNLVNTKHDFETQWQIPLSKSWFSKLIPA